MFIASSSEPLPSLFKAYICGPNLAPPRMSHVLLIEVLHLVSFVKL